MLIAALLFIGGLALLLFAATHFIDGIAAFAEYFGVPPLVVGMTLVAFGTSTPELVVNTLSAWRGETALAFGNVIGSCTVNLGFVLAVTSIVKPLRVEPSIITREIPMLLVGVVALLILSADSRFEGASSDSFGREDGLILLLLFSIFVYYTAIYSIARHALKIGAKDAFIEEVKEEQPRRTLDRMWLRAIITILGLIGVSVGADWTVSGASTLARLIGIAENVIGLTVVSLGTTLPELVTCVMAAKRGNADIAIGNIVGSNLFNILAVGGLVSVVRPIAIPPGGHTDMLVMATLTCVLLPITIRSGRTVTRGEGGFLLACYAAYMVYRLTHLQ